jgi:hypothetical protein
MDRRSDQPGAAPKSMAGDVEAALRALEAAGLPTAEAADLRKRLAPRPQSGVAAATIRHGERQVVPVSAWREWAKRGTVRRVGS